MDPVNTGLLSIAGVMLALFLMRRRRRLRDD